jgi:hypothetical protein
MDNIVEISGLAKQRNASSMAPLYLYRQMWHHSLYKKHDLWIMACDVRLFQRLSILLGDAIIQIGSQTKYKGGDVIPSLVMPKEALHALVTSAIQAKLMKRYLRLLVVEFFLDGLSADMISKSDYKELTKHRDVKN